VSDEASGRAVEFPGPERVETVPIEEPVPGPDEVVVSASVSAVSAGSELLAYRGEFDPETVADEELSALDGDLSYPLRYGYAVVGRVAAVGDDVDPAWRGRTVFAFTPHESRFAVPVEAVRPIPDGIDPETATPFANAETAVTLTLDAAPRIGERVAVFGQGVVGVLTTALLARSGAETVAAVDPKDGRRELAAEFGADAVVDPSRHDDRAGVIDAVRERAGDGVDLDMADRLVTDRVPVADAPAAYRRLADEAEPTLQLLFTHQCTS
jgi:threonine dehydrogenase-like Zn-dependent dehydrogenase